jgi:4-aminobutyrate aminotransferase
MFACEHWGVEPDIICSAKGLGSGLPIGAVIARKSLMSQWQRGAHGNTYGGNPITCAAASATLDLVDAEYRDNASKVGAYFLAELAKLQGEFSCIGDLRGKGLMIGMELVLGDETHTPAVKLCDALINRAYYNGLLLLSCGVSTVRFMPPLCATSDDIDDAMARIRASLIEAMHASA